ncbi:hypothetical protein FA15DRAFT_610192 [Coprinopsis marcescibilis]|uniref:RING-type domain-containing protein n=1 Tax=Coprinopsis marcescibilis TaxID=230819 RepID=A0A5C3L9W7_COPMA|nr:hypothetical protein FA15DRAFT_610192 [Coprinopsis marcescibilis]
MSAGEALSALQLIYGVVSKVKDNKEELQCLTQRIQLVVESLEDSKTRDVIRDSEYNDALTTVSELISRTQRLTRRMLKRSLGDRTWNSGEIAADLRRLNEDVQTFLSLHAIKTLDLVRTSQSEQYSSLAVSVEEIIAKITELDIAMKESSKPKPLPAGAQTAINETSLPGYGALLAQVQSLSLTRGPEGSQSIAKGWSDLRAGSAAAVGRTGPQERPVLFDKLASVNTVPLTIYGLTKSSASDETFSKTFMVKANAKVKDVYNVVAEAGFNRPAHFLEETTLPITVTEGTSVYDASAPGGLQISKTEPLLWWKDKYDEYHGSLSGDKILPMKTEVRWNSDTISVAEVDIKCHRTLRVPDSDDEGASSLPPDLGAFPLFPVSQLGSRVSEDMKRRGGFVLPMFRREALWISFCSDEDSERPAVKVSVGGVNAISGVPTSAPAPLKSSVHQDYIVAGLQPWLDGIAIGDGFVRQFVVTELHKGYTVEEQVTGKAKVGGIQFDIYPRRTTPSGQFKVNSGDTQAKSVVSTPAELGLAVGSTISYFRPSSSMTPQIYYNWVLSDYIRQVPFPPGTRNPHIRAAYVDYGAMLAGSPGFWGEAHSSRRVLGIAAGGKIVQKIYKDKNSTRVYNEELGRRFHIHIVTPEVWEELTGIVPPFTPVNRDLYLRHGIPWFKLFDDYVEAITGVSEALKSVVSVAQLDKKKFGAGQPTPDPVVNPDAPPPCHEHPISTASCIFRPCGHPACPQCLGSAILGGSKCSCGSAVSKFVGLKQPIPQISAVATDKEGDDEGHWDIQQIEQLATHAVKFGKVQVIHLFEDDVAPLKQWNEVQEPQRTTPPVYEA